MQPLFENLLKSRLDPNSTRPDNQIASLFARWAFPQSGVEMYGELGREDNAWDMRDLMLEPDHDMAYMLGLSRVWRRPAGRLFVVRGELLNTAISHLSRVRWQAPPYIHFPIILGHTQDGQLLGAPSGYGGGAAALHVDVYSPASRLTFTWRRAMRVPPPDP